MEWVLLWAFGFSIQQIHFETEQLCEDAKYELSTENDADSTSMNCVRVSVSLTKGISNGPNI